MLVFSSNLRHARTNPVSPTGMVSSVRTAFPYPVTPHPDDAGVLSGSGASARWWTYCVGATSNPAVMSSILNLKTECLSSKLRSYRRSPHFLSPGTAPDGLLERSQLVGVYTI